MDEETTQPESANATQEAGAEVFSFGDPVPVLEASDILEYVQALYDGRCYQPPVSFRGLAKTYRANPHHASAIQLKRNILVETFEPNALLSRQDFSRLALDYLIFGNGYLERIDNRIGKPVKLKPSLALNTRRMKEEGAYLFQHGWKKEHVFKVGSVWHLMEPDTHQEIYGLPEYMAAMHSAWLNESATLFRRKYYKNGSHAGYIMFLTDATQTQEDIDNIKEQLKNSKGPGNFKNLFVYAPNGKKDGLQIIPISEVTAKDEFFNIKNITRDDVLAAHRAPPQLMSIVPNNTGGFGSVESATKVFVVNELMPLQARFRELNEWLGQEVIRFRPYELGVKDEGRGWSR